MGFFGLLGEKNIGPVSRFFQFLIGILFVYWSIYFVENNYSATYGIVHKISLQLFPESNTKYRVDKNRYFLTPSPPHLVQGVIECPLTKPLLTLFWYQRNPPSDSI